MSSLRTLLPCLVTLLAIGCDNAVDLGPAIEFARPEHLAFACFAPRTADPAQFALLPQACCTSDAAKRPAGGVCSAGGVAGAPRLHALVTQSTRGEVAAVDILPNDERVIDSDSLIPGYTYLDSGGLPTAIVVPPHQQVPSNPGLGPRYTFVASAEEFQVRAIPTCRFRSGSACGPELKPLDAAGGPLVERLRVALPAAPGDMILGPDAALWVTLPELGLIARIPLADAEKFPADAFERDDVSGRPRAPQFFRVPQPAAVEPPPPVAETDPYVHVCGTDSDYLQQEIALPPAPRAAMAPIRPLRMHFERLDPGAPDGVLLVSDAAAPVVHAFALGADGSLAARGALPTGAPLRAFVLTPPVPARVAREQDTTPVVTPADAPLLDPRRYLYAIDDRDGSLMVFDYAVDAGRPRLTPLLAPVPSARFADRIDVPAPAAALDIIDSRTIGPAECLTQPNYLRGVFVAVASQSGTVSLVDVYDGDLACRARAKCNYAGGDAKKLVDTGSASAVAIRRHVARRSFAAGLTGELTASSDLFAAEACEGRGMVPVVEAANVQERANGPLVCAPSDPWFQRADSWSVQYRAPLPGTLSTGGGVVSRGDPGAAQLLLDVPDGFDVCGRGVLPGDLVALFDPEEGRRDPTCAALGGSEPANLLTVVEARRDQLVLQPALEPVPDNPSLNQQRADQLAGCFLNFVSFEVRAKDFLVTAQRTGTYLHNVIANLDGTCVPDLARPLITSRAAPGERFRNPYLSFKLRPGADESTSTSRNATIQLGDGSGTQTIDLLRSELPDVLPATVRYQPDYGELYIVDSASQGLQRFSLQPLARVSSR